MFPSIPTGPVRVLPRLHLRAQWIAPLVLAALLGIGVALPSGGADGSRATRLTDNIAQVLGPAACSECHVDEFEVWQASQHQMGSKMLTRNKEAQRIAKALGIRRVKSDARCTSCHFTRTGDPAKPKAIAGVSCESCHGPAADWIDVHNDFGGNGVQLGDETSDHHAERVARSDQLGMVRPGRSHAIAMQCYSCHTIDDQELIEAGHPSGEGFEFVAWSQGEMRHNFLRDSSRANVLAAQARMREMYVVGQLLELQSAAEALSLASGAGLFAERMLARAEGAVKKLEQILERVDVQEIRGVLAAAAQWERGPGRASADLAVCITGAAQTFEARGPGAELGALDALLPSTPDFVGTPAR